VLEGARRELAPPKPPPVRVQVSSLSLARVESCQSLSSVHEVEGRRGLFFY
jgi:hypothetical protein